MHNQVYYIASVMKYHVPKTRKLHRMAQKVALESTAANTSTIGVCKAISSIGRREYTRDSNIRDTFPGQNLRTLRADKGGDCFPV